jgi:hypothetical protein
VSRVEICPICRLTSFACVRTSFHPRLSGIPPNPPDWFSYQRQIPNDVRAQREAASMDALQSTPRHVPGTKYLYSNWGFVLAGHIVEELTDTTWEEVLATRLFEPLDILLNKENVSSFTGAPNNDVAPWGHLGNDQTPCNPSTSSYKCDNPSVMGPAGTFSGPVAAMAAYFAWHIRCHNGDGDNPLILSQNACQELHQPADPSLGEYGYGWICTSRTWADGLTCTHTGSNNLNYYVVWLGFGIDRGFVAFTNGGGRSGSADFAMVDEAVSTAINGPSKCESRIPSSYYASKPTIVEEACAAETSPSCSCVESDVPGSPVMGGRFNLKCENGEVCFCGNGNDIPGNELCSSHTSTRTFDPPFESISSIEDVVMYSRGRDDEVRITLDSCTGSGTDCPFQYTCSMEANGVQCNRCSLCANYTGGFGIEGVTPGISFNCSNIESGATYDLCLDPPSLVTDGVFRFLSDDVCDGMCGATFDQCDGNSDCCSGRCFLDRCRGLFTGGKASAKIGRGRGGAAGRLAGDRRGVRGR